MMLARTNRARSLPHSLTLAFRSAELLSRGFPRSGRTSSLPCSPRALSFEALPSFLHSATQREKAAAPNFVSCEAVRERGRGGRASTRRQIQRVAMRRRGRKRRRNRRRTESLRRRSRKLRSGSRRRRRRPLPPYARARPPARAASSADAAAAARDSIDVCFT